ncbi:uncharacterized protein LOC143280586 [Babylonia areolata]|uniref:uncharacterized protein LOC143280586 n=1 Tax=Babylonia areolata TaxID=304850 RepID=UPI003FCF4824
MASTGLFFKLLHVSSSTTTPENIASSLAGPLVPPYHIATTTTTTTTLAGPLDADDGNNITTTTPLTEPLGANLTTPLAHRGYDYHGAMVFTVATVCVYGLSIVFFIAGHTLTQKRELNKDEERQISTYLKRMHLDESSQDDRNFHVVRLKSVLLAESALGQRHNRRVSLMPRSMRSTRREAMRPAAWDGCGEEGEDGDPPPGTPLLQGECTVQNVNELLQPPFRGRRMACVGLGRAVGSGGGGGEGPRDGHHGGWGLNPQGPPSPHLTSLLASIEEDEVSLHSLDRSDKTSSSNTEESQPELSPTTLPAAVGWEDDPPNYESLQEHDAAATGREDSSGSQHPAEENMPNDAGAAVMITRL